MRRRPVLATVGMLLATLSMLVAAASAGATPRAAVSPAGPVSAAGARQQPDAPADDGTGASADDQVTDGEVTDDPVPGDGIIPEPNSGHPPDEAGDRGGALQVLVLALIVVGVGGIATMGVRESRRNRARQADTSR